MYNYGYASFVIPLYTLDQKEKNRRLIPLDCLYTKTENHGNGLRFAWEYSVWLLHELTKFQYQKSADRCINLLRFHCTN